MTQAIRKTNYMTYIGRIAPCKALATMARENICRLKPIRSVNAEQLHIKILYSIEIDGMKEIELLIYYVLNLLKRPAQITYCNRQQSISYPKFRITYRNEKIRHSPLILYPSFPISLPTPVDIPPRTMNNHHRKENRIKPREWRVEACNQTPGGGEKEVACIMHFAGETVYQSLASAFIKTSWGKRTPSTTQDRITSLCPNNIWILDVFPRQLRKCLSVDWDAALLGSEEVLLAVSCVPDPVCEEVHSKECTQSQPIPPIGVWVMPSQIQGAMAVTHRHTGEVPENEHEPPFFVIHVPTPVRFPSAQQAGARHLPTSNNQLLPLGTSIRIQKVRHEQKPNLPRHITKLFKLLQRCSQ